MLYSTVPYSIMVLVPGTYQSYIIIIMCALGTKHETQSCKASVLVIET